MTKPAGAEPPDPAPSPTPDPPGDGPAREPEEAPKETTGPRPDGAEEDRSISKEDALQALKDGGGDEAEREESVRAKQLIDDLVRRLRDLSSAAIGNVTMFNGGVNIGGDFGIAAGGAAGRAGVNGLLRVDSERLAQHVDRYLRPPAFADALELLSAGQILVLAIPPGTGREAAAFNLLAEAMVVGGCDDEDAGCYFVTDSGLLAGLDWKPPSRGSGYVVLLDGAAAGGPAERAVLTPESIDEHWIAGMAGKLKDARSFMVVVTGLPRGALVDGAARGEHVLTTLGEVDLLRVVEQHALGNDATPRLREELHYLLAESGAMALLEEQPQPRIAVQVAVTIRGDGDLVSAVRALRDPTHQVHTWFSQHRDLEELCLALAAAALEDSGYLTISDAAVKLYADLTVGAGAPPDLRLWERIGSGHPWIEVVAADESDVVPGPPRVRFRNPLVQHAVLSYMWTNLDGRRTAILDWLRGLVTHPDTAVRVRASVAAGLIAWSDHDYAVNRYLRVWAGNSSRVLRLGAATALEVMGTNPALAEAAWILLESWAAETTTQFGRRLSATAAEAVGGVFGMQQPVRALAILRTALDSEDWTALLPVSWSVTHLIEQGCIAEVLTALLEWSEPQDSSTLVVKALSVFVFAARQPSPEETPSALAGSASSDAGRPPPLIVHARAHQTEIAELWARALARKPAQGLAQEVLHECLDSYADHDRAALRAMKAILLDVAQHTGRHRERLDWYLGQWARDTEHPSASAAEIHEALQRLG